MAPVGVVVLHPYTKFELWKIWRAMCVSISGPCDHDLWPFDHETNTHLRWGTFLPNLGTLWVLELFAMYATDRRAVGRTKATLIAPSPTGAGHNNYSNLPKLLLR